jgi:hypothetical protein
LFPRWKYHQQFASLKVSPSLQSSVAQRFLSEIVIQLIQSAEIEINPRASLQYIPEKLSHSYKASRKRVGATGKSFLARRENQVAFGA